MLRKTSQPNALMVLGAPVLDVYLEPDVIRFGDQVITFSYNAQQFSIPYQGEYLRWGEKRMATMDLADLDQDFPDVPRKNGGGARNTIVHLAELNKQKNLGLGLYAIDLALPWPELKSEYAKLGVQHLTLGIEKGPTNFIFTNGAADRVILKSPVRPALLTEEQSTDLFSRIGGNATAILINSLKSPQLASPAIDFADLEGLGLYAVLTPSLPMDLLLELLSKASATVCNLSEFALVSHAVGNPCPSSELSAPLGDVADAMTRVGHITNSRDMVVTLGSRGCLVYEHRAGNLNHISLRKRLSHSVQDTVGRHPARRNGAGDRFFGSFALTHHLQTSNAQSSASKAAISASADVVCSLAPELTLDSSWFKLRRLSRPLMAREGGQNLGRPKRGAYVVT